MIHIESQYMSKVYTAMLFSLRWWQRPYGMYDLFWIICFIDDMGLLCHKDMVYI